MRYLASVLCYAVAVSPAGAATLYLTSGVSVYQNGQVSDYRGQQGLVEERFATGPNGACVQTHATAIVFSSLGSPIGPFPTSAGLVRGVFPGRALPPGSTSESIRDGIPIADQSCYLAVPKPASGLPSGQIAADIGFNYKSPIFYFGFYWGSMGVNDTLTLLSRPDANGVRTPIAVGGLSDPNGVIGAGQLLALFGHPVSFNSYVSLQFSAPENFGTVIFGAASPGFVVDNIAFSNVDFLALPPAQNQHTPTTGALPPTPAAQPSGPRAAIFVPEPALVGLFGLAFGPVALGLRRRRRHARYGFGRA